ncbi:MAG: hemolysin-type calcium-binding protein [Ramlibacter sp.]|jgi:Ca2+-binding RTX toxin-like protein|nr:hemolysin-type calcium-binding protein [Ramlibacter sp.]
MATLLAKFAFDYTQLDLSGLGDAHDWGFEDNANITLNGIKYEDVVWFEEFPAGEAVGFAGTGITINGEQVTGGTVTGVVAEHWNGTNWIKDWYLQGISVPAVSLYNAALTPSVADDMSLVSKALSGADTFMLSNFNDRMRGFGGNDLLAGKAGNDTLAGDGGNDTLCGGTGSDILTGGAGSDVFDFNLATESSNAKRDVITDFVRGMDKIDLSGIDANPATATNQAFAGFIKAGAEFTRAGQLKFVDGVLFGNTDSDSAAEFAIVLTGVTNLSAADLVL